MTENKLTEEKVLKVYERQCDQKKGWHGSIKSKLTNF